MLHMTTFYDREEDSTLLKYARENRESGYFNDITIWAGKECFSANRLVLSCYSPFFRTMFKSKLKEQYENNIEIKHGNGSFIKRLVDYIYDGSISVDNSDVMGLLSAADFLQLDDIRQVCLSHLEQNLQIDNCYDVLEVADYYKSAMLKQKVETFIDENFEELSKDLQFKTSSKERVVDLISSLNRNIVSETSIYHAILNWINYKEGRRRDFAALFNLVNLNELSSKFLEEVVSKEDLVKANLSCTNAVLQVISSCLQEVRLTKNCTSVVCIGGFWTDEEVMEVFNCFGEAAKLYPKVPKGSCISCSAKLDDCFYAIGGNPATMGINSASNTMFKLKINQKLLKWVPAASMQEQRTAFASAVFRNVLYVTGGRNEKNTISSTELYDPVLNSWQIGGHLNQSRCGHALVANNNYLFVIGGKSDNCYLHSMEQLELGNGVWKLTAPMLKPRHNFAAVYCNGFIFAIGGQSGTENETTTNSVEKFDQVKNRWSFVKSMNIARSAFSATVLQGRIFVVGGLNAKKIAVKEIECYNPSLNSWTIVKTIDHKLFYHSAIAV